MRDSLHGRIVALLTIACLAGLAGLAGRADAEEADEVTVAYAEFSKEPVREDGEVAAWRWRVDLTLRVPEGPLPRQWRCEIHSPAIDALVAASTEPPTWFRTDFCRKGRQPVALTGTIRGATLQDVSKSRLLADVWLRTWVEGETEAPADSPFVRVLSVGWSREDLGGYRMQWELTLDIEKRPTRRPVSWWFTGSKLAWLTEHTTPTPTWEREEQSPTHVRFRARGIHQSEHVPALLRYTRFAWRKDIEVRAARQRPARPARPAPRTPVEFDTEDDRPLGPDSRLGLATSRDLIERWTTERKEIDARAAHIGDVLDAMADGEKVRTARDILAGVRDLLAGDGLALSRVTSDMDRQRVGVRLEDRQKLNTLHFKAYRQLNLIESMFIGAFEASRR